MGLSNEQLAFFEENGYVVARNLFDSELMKSLMVEIDGLHEKMSSDQPDTVQISWEDGLPENSPPRIRQLMNSESVSPIIDGITRSEKMLDIIDQLIGPEIYLFHSKLMMKAAKQGSFTPWHQDWGYWMHHEEQPLQVNAMLAIDPQTIENGCLRFVPGSQKQGPLEHTNNQAKSFVWGLGDKLDDFENLPVEMQSGDVVFFGPLVIHGSTENMSAMHRRANTFAFSPPANGKKYSIKEENLRRTVVE